MLECQSLCPREIFLNVLNRYKEKQMKTKQAMIEDVMHYFDFSRVHQCMKALEFTLVGRAPEEHEIHKSARKLMLSVPPTYNHEEYDAGIWGLYTRVFCEDIKLNVSDALKGSTI